MFSCLHRIQGLIRYFPYFLLFFAVPCGAQTSKVDSLLLRLQQPMHDTVRLQTLRKLSVAYSSVDPKQKFYYANVYLDLARKLHNEEAVSDAYSDMGVSYGIRSKMDSALFYFNLAYEQAKKHDYLLGMGKSLSNIGFMLDRQDNYRESIRHYFRALAIFKKMNYVKGLNQVYTNIGSIYFDLKQYKLAQTYFKQCLDNAIQSGDEASIAYAMFTMGNCYSALDQHAEAEASFNKSLAIREKLGDHSGIAVVRRSLGEMYTDEGKHAKAIENLRVALENIRIVQDKYVEVAILNAFTQAYLGQKNYVLAAKYGEESLAISRDQVKSKMMEAETLAKLVKVYQAMNRLDKAFGYQSEYSLIRDSLLDQAMLKDVTLTELGRARTENLELAKSNKQITSENTSYLEKLNRYSKAITATAVVLILVVLATVVLYRRNKAKLAKNKLLLQQKEQIAVINRELETLNEELTTQMELTNAQNLELERLNDIKNKFFSIISHDLRSPLATLRSLFSIYREGDLGDEELSELLARLEETILNTSSFLDNLLEWARSQMDGIVVNRVDFDISQSISENVSLLYTQAEMKKLVVSNLASTALNVYADRDMMSLVIRNLLSNSIKFCSPGDSITITAKVEDNKALISISDTGRGISENDQGKLFNLQHALSTGTQGEKGTRLGLILCRDMLLQNDGKIWFEPGKELGSVFLFELPLV